MDVFTAISGRRSCRKFHPEAVSDTDIEKILEAGKDPVALLCVGKPASSTTAKREDFREKTTYLR